MSRQKDVLTTGDVARICKVAPRTVSKWFDTGQLRGYRIPGSKDRRIPLQQLIRFMRAHGIPLNGLDTGQTRVLIVDGDRELTALLQRSLTDSGGYEVEVAESLFEAGAATERLRPSLMLIDTDLPGLDPASLRRYFTTRTEFQGTRLIATSASLTDADREVLRQQGFTAAVAKPFSIRQLADVFEAALTSSE